MRKLLRLLLGISVKKSTSNEIIDKEPIYSRDELKEVLVRLYKCRDLEISNLWQRSVFLSVFMVLCFSGYGYLLLQIIESITNCCSNPNKFFYLNIAAVALGCVSVVFSLLWTFMAKSSKAWYEVYETAISTFEAEYADVLRIPKYYKMGEMGLCIRKINPCIYSAKAGAFSPSRINIAIGQVCFTVWCEVIILHLLFMTGIQISIMYLPIVLIVTTILIALFLVFSKWIKSGHLSNHIYDKKGRCIE